jgi:hypothetical protein
MAFIVSDYWQGLGLGTKMVDYVLDIVEEKSIESLYTIMMQDNYRALSLTKKMEFQIDYLSDGKVKANLNLKREDIDFRCALPKISLLPIKKEPPIIQAQEKEKTGSSFYLKTAFL